MPDGKLNLTVRLDSLAVDNYISHMKRKEGETPDPSVLAAELRAQLSRLKRRLREQADPGKLTSSELAVILRLEMTGSATVSELSRLEGIRPQSMRNTVLSLKEKGYILGHADPDDGRKTCLSLTEEGRALMNRGRKVWNDWLTSAISGKLNGEEQILLGRAVDLIRRLTDY